MKRKVEKKNLPIKDPKIKKIYTKFKDIIFKKIKKESFALAVSGGPDSLCLAYLSKLYQFEFKNKIYVLIVNHRLRKESYKEALKVKKILKKKIYKAKFLIGRAKFHKVIFNEMPEI